MDFWASDSNGVALIETRIGPITLRTDFDPVLESGCGLKKISAANGR